MIHLDIGRVKEKLYYQELAQPFGNGNATIWLGTKTGSIRDKVGEIQLRIKPESKLMAIARTKKIIEEIVDSAIVGGVYP